MTEKSRAQSSGLSRRTIFVRGIAFAAGTAALFGRIRQAAAKMAQTAVSYQETPKGDQQCSNCSLFQPPSSCQLVDGTINPSGWCRFWVKKTS